MNKKNHNYKVDYKSVFLGVAICTVITGATLILLAIGINNNRWELESTFWISNITQLTSVFLGVFLSQKIRKNQSIIETAIVIGLYCFIIASLAIAIFNGITMQTFLSMLFCAAGGMLGFLLGRKKNNAQHGHRKKRVK